ncbi:hypothetical protein DICPUDRAFT_29296 [Dictyostelium purpureum]|uniref:THO complex subunit 1 n=1 Tax=Dictyostelium purpureum TaxID=5786 RepID=F0ZDE5_DICPU|nr:uncharacterized protein DICPUDRAFT_29296 [Dictyostelium purpureum]EGC38053.1 hypothetical protein DICPUDRAFT_29296 [Dictyostelium purpureum]|eukprot:XP_003285454.1 hypothetical protein DICPUDRAFT_29296 [Dictyostelium purpureum]
MQDNLIKLFDKIIKKEIDVYNDNEDKNETNDSEMKELEEEEALQPTTTTTIPTSIFNKDKLINELSSQFPSFDINKIEIKSSIDINIRLFFNILIKEKNTTYEDIDVTIQLAYIFIDIFGLDSILPLQLSEDLYETKTINECLKLFGLLESRAELFSQDPEIIKGRKRNLLLKICVELLKRFSRSSNPDSCGRILLFLAYVFPLSDPSGLNGKGEHNVHPEESLDFQNDIMKNIEDGSSEDQTIDKNFYTQFWGLQTIFQNPQTVLFNNITATSITLNKAKWDSFIQALELVIGSFSTHINLEDLQQSNPTKQHYFTKYLTSSNLMKLQLKDSTFRRNILTQILITFQNLDLTGQKYPTLFNDLQVNIIIAFKTIYHYFLFINFIKNIIQDLTIKCYKILSNTQPGGEYFSNCLSSILKREKNWIIWKRDNGCKNFERPPCSPIVKKKKPVSKKSNRMVMGNVELSRLWNLSGGVTDRSYLKTQNSVLLESLIDPLTEEQIEFEEKQKQERLRLERIKKKEEKRLEQNGIKQAEYEKDKKEFFEIEANKGKEYPEFEEVQKEIDSDDLSDLDEPKQLKKDNPLYVWKTLRLISRKKLDLFKYQKFDEIIQSFIKPITPISTTPTVTTTASTATTTDSTTPTESVKSNNSSPIQKPQEIASVITQTE